MKINPKQCGDNPRQSKEKNYGTITI